MNRLQEKYQKKIVPKLLKELGLSNPLAAPKLVKIVVSTSFLEAQHQDEAIKKTAGWLSVTTGQKPLPTRAHQSIAGFGVREGDLLGLKVTLRGKRMWEFLDKTIAVDLPRVKDFQGLPIKSFDGMGNYTFGIKEQIIFPEIEYDDIDKIRGLQITISTNAGSDKKALSLLKELGIPFSASSADREKEATLGH